MKTAIQSLWPVDDLRTFLTGVWQIERAVDGASPFALGHLRGTARFKPGDGTMHYIENGHLALGPSTAVVAERNLVFDFPLPHRAAVRFGNGSPFHDLDLTTGGTSVVHIRAGDVYRGRYVVLSRHRWCVAWRVTGPTRDFRTMTRYSRLC